MIIKLLTGNYLEFLSLKGGCTGSSESTLVKMQYCWKSHVMAHYNEQSVRLPKHFTISIFYTKRVVARAPL